ncbi:flagellar motor protein MotB [Aquibacillus sp. 3ASR75-11]|uniref:Flagellar motor protein MotB n=1 Tax=Terrihalobacillus insolitus TaxID=2950438 RepID=A0A9X4ALR2_9BACI|nr:flagellar motor protein MotS [Terrihalobacillus insolitus]MDC3412679.1 flagellar motor protein MotB [Terrihalobacillus insolitus]MDC3424029.1 flagellar motor protein MotB [Terrihalobacillus insolitus]
MKLRRKQKKPDKGAPRWMVTYSDMMTLILVFFILLFSMSQIDLVKFEAIAESFRNRMVFEFYPSPVPMDNPAETSDPIESEVRSNDIDLPKESYQGAIQQPEESSENDESLDSLLNAVQSFLDEQNLNDVITANHTEEGVVLILQEQVLFESAEANIIDAGKPFLDKVGTLLSNIPNQVRVEGHTDNRPISNYRFPSNWELSAARASSVIRYVIDQQEIQENRFIAVGYGDTRPVVPNTSPENWNKNRRVEIVILEKEQ